MFQNVLTRLSQLTRTQKILVLVIIFMSIALMILVSLSKKSNVSSELDATNSEKPLPQIQIADYSLQTDLPQVPTVVSSFTLATSQTKEDAKKIATNFGFLEPTVVEKGDFVAVTDTLSRSSLQFDKTTGAFFFFTAGKRPLSVPLTSPIEVATSYLVETQLQDGTLTCSAFYKRQSMPGVTFVECHRAWSKLGYPILNVLGVLNTPQQTKLSDLRLGDIDETGPKDPDIIESSDGKAGLVRPNGFNTITVALSENTGGVTAVTSSIRPIVSKSTQEAAVIRTPKQALEEIKAGGPEVFLLTRPSGEGLLDVNMVYPNNKGTLKNAVITDMVFGFIEDLPNTPQKKMSLAYIVKGRARLESGFDTSFVATIPAIRGETSVLGMSTQLALVPTSELCKKDGGIKYCTIPFGKPSPTPIPSPTVIIPTIEPSPTVIPTIPPTIPIPTVVQPTVPTPTPRQCPEFAYEYTLPNGSKLAFRQGAFTPSNEDPRAFWYIPREGEFGADDLAFIQAKIVVYLGEIGINDGKTVVYGFCSPKELSVCAIKDPAERNKKTCYDVPLVSPNIYVRSSKNRSVSIGLSKNTTSYAEPVFTNSETATWNFHVVDETLLRFEKEGIKDKLFYLYNKEALTPILSKLVGERQGFIFKKEELHNRLSILLSSIGLSQKQKEDLLDEVIREMNTIPGDSVQIAFVKEDLLKTVLPLSITPQPKSLRRIHIVIDKAHQNGVIQSPVIVPLEEDEYSVVETGVINVFR